MCSLPYFIPEAANDFTQMCIRHFPILPSCTGRVAGVYNKGIVYIVYMHLHCIHMYTYIVYIHLHCIHTLTMYTYTYIVYIHLHCIHMLTFYTYTYNCIQQGLCSLQIIFWKPFPAGSFNTCPPMSKVVAFRPELNNQRLLRILLQLLFRLILSPQQACSSITSLNSCSKFMSKFDQTYCYYLANKRFESLVHQQKEKSVFFNAAERKKVNKIFSNI